MSKKNSKPTRKRHLDAAIQKEKEEREKREKKLQKKKEDSEKKNQRLGVNAGPAKKLKKKGIRIRKNVVIRGIKVKDAESKKKVREVLAAEEAMQQMLVDEAGAGPSDCMVVG